jgi:predicted transcriptional regulator
VAQSIGRYARNADRPDEPTVVFVWTAAIPDELVDWQIEDVRPLTDTQKDVVDYVEENRPVSTREVANELDISKEAARQTLKKLEEDGLVSVDENAGKYGANLYNIQRKVSGFLNFSDLA